MLRLVYVIGISLPFVIFYLIKVSYYIRNDEKYTDEQRYLLARKLICRMKKNGRIHTISYGREKLPGENGYIMFSNHQGKYDALGIIDAHDRPCSVLIDDKASHALITTQFVDLLHGIRMDKTDMRKQVEAIRRIANEVKNGKIFLVFPEGGYSDNRNMMQEFLAGAFKCAQLSKSPIIPVAIYDSYKVFSVNSLKKVRTQVSFLDPIPYEEYKGMNTRAISQMVKGRIQAELERLAEFESEYSRTMFMNV